MPGGNYFAAMRPSKGKRIALRARWGVRTATIFVASERKRERHRRPRSFIPPRLRRVRPAPFPRAAVLADPSHGVAILPFRQRGERPSGVAGGGKTQPFGHPALHLPAVIAAGQMIADDGLLRLD